MKRLLKHIIISLVTLYSSVRFYDLWNFKEYLFNKTIMGKRVNFFTNMLIESYKCRMKKEGGYIDYRSKFSGRPIFPHGYNGIFISPQATVGKGAIILQQVTIGVAGWPKNDTNPAPIIGDNVLISSGVKVVGGGNYWK